MVGTMLQPGLDTTRAESDSQLEVRLHPGTSCSAGRTGNAAIKGLSPTSQGLGGSGPAYEIVFARNNVCVHPLTGKAHASQFIPGRLSLIKLNEVLFLTWLPYVPAEPSASEDAFVLLSPADASSLQGDGVGKSDVSIDASNFCSGDEADSTLYTIRPIEMSEIHSIRRHAPALGLQYIIIMLTSGLAFPPLFFHEGGVREFLRTVKEHVLLVRSSDDGNVFLVNDASDPLQKSLSVMDLHVPMSSGVNWPRWDDIEDAYTGRRGLGNHNPSSGSRDNKPAANGSSSPSATKSWGTSSASPTGNGRGATSSTSPLTIQGARSGGGFFSNGSSSGILPASGGPPHGGITRSISSSRLGQRSLDAETSMDTSLALSNQSSRVQGVVATANAGAGSGAANQGIFDRLARISRLAYEVASSAAPLLPEVSSLAQQVEAAIRNVVSDANPIPSSGTGTPRAGMGRSLWSRGGFAFGSVSGSSSPKAGGNRNGNGNGHYSGGSPAEYNERANDAVLSSLLAERLQMRAGESLHAAATGKRNGNGAGKGNGAGSYGNGGSKGNGVSHGSRSSTGNGATSGNGSERTAEGSSSNSSSLNGSANVRYGTTSDRSYNGAASLARSQPTCRSPGQGGMLIGAMNLNGDVAKSVVGLAMSTPNLPPPPSYAAAIQMPAERDRTAVVANGEPAVAVCSSSDRGDPAQAVDVASTDVWRDGAAVVSVSIPGAGVQGLPAGSMGGADASNGNGVASNGIRREGEAVGEVSSGEDSDGSDWPHRLMPEVGGVEATAVCVVEGESAPVMPPPPVCEDEVIEVVGADADTEVGMFEILDGATAQGLSPKGHLRSRARPPPLGKEEWATFLDGMGRVTDVRGLQARVFFGGVEPSLRCEVWKFLLGYYPFKSTYSLREEIREQKREEYFALKAQWESVTDDQASRFAKFRERRSGVEKDVVRTDRQLPFYAGEGNPNVDIMRSILITYSFYNFDLGYCQGMSDLLSPILYVMRDEVDAFWCFVALMGRLASNFHRDQNGMHSQLLLLTKLVYLLDRPLHNYLRSVDCLNYFFCFRWLLIDFKREFPYDQVLQLWEVLWSSHGGEYFHLFMCVAILRRHRHKIMGDKMDFDTLLRFTNDMSGRIDLESTLWDAEMLCRCACSKKDVYEGSARLLSSRA